MGADVYLQSVYEPHFAANKATFEAAVAKRDKIKAKANGGGESPAYAKAQEAVTEAYEAMYDRGYFRDSYNSTSLFWMLGLSWWQIGDIGLDGPGSPALIDDEGLMQPAACKRLLGHLEKVDFDKRFAVWVGERRATVQSFDKIDFDKPGNSVEDWRAMFARKLGDFTDLLRQAIERNEALRCSV